MRVLVVLLSCILLGETFAEPSTYSANSTSVSLSRKKRALTFPKGSAFVVTLTLIKAIQVKVPTNWNLDLEFDMIWPIPMGIDVRKPPLLTRRQRPYWQQPHRRHRRELYANLELALDSQGLPGNLCILRTICEAKVILNPPGISLVEDVLRVIFSYPTSNSVSDDYDNAYRSEEDCDLAYPCPFSLLDLLLNYHNDVSKYK